MEFSSPIFPFYNCCTFPLDTKYSNAAGLIATMCKHCSMPSLIRDILRISGIKTIHSRWLKLYIIPLRADDSERIRREVLEVFGRYRK